MDPRVIILLAAEALFALFLLARLKTLKDIYHTAAAILLLAAAFYARALALPYETLDYQDFLKVWVQYFRDWGGFRGLRFSVGNYNIPYLYFLAAISYSGIYDLFLIKLFSIFFDVLLAFSAAGITGLFYDSPTRKLTAFFLTLFLPTVFLNGSLWGQCDSVYTALGMLGVYYGLKRKSALSVILITLSFAVKLQAVFILPFYAVLLMKKYIKPQHIMLFPLTYAVSVTPAVIAGRPFIDTLTLYFKQTGSIGNGLNYNSSSVFAILDKLTPDDNVSAVFIILAFIYMFSVLVPAFFSRKGLGRKDMLVILYLLVAGIPFFLPHMHDRYFFAADISALILAVVIPELAPVAVLTQFASLLGYHAYLKMRYLMPMRYGAFALIASITLCMIWLYKQSDKKSVQESP